MLELLSCWKGSWHEDWRGCVAGDAWVCPWCMGTWVSSSDGRELLKQTKAGALACEEVGYTVGGLA